MRLATWNVNGLRSRFDFLLHWLRSRRPDVVGLQELKLEEDKFPRLELEAEGYHAIVHGQKAWNGVAILAREPGEPVQAGLPEQAEMGARLVTAQVGDVSFTTIYCPNGKTLTHADYPRKLRWLDALGDHLQATHDPSRPMVLCGDFNICPTALDTCHGDVTDRIFHTADERQRFQRLLDWGLVDVFRERYPDQRSYSWWDYRAGSFHRNQGMRIDLILASRPLLARARSVEIDREYRKKKDGMTTSDHAPVMLDLD